MWRDEAYLLDILIAARKVLQYTEGVDEQAFQDSDVLQDAVMRQVQIIGEAARALSPEIRDEHPEVPWQGIVGMRNKLVHHYFRIDVPLVWEVVERDIPSLIAQIEPIVPKDDEGSQEATED